MKFMKLLAKIFAIPFFCVGVLAGLELFFYYWHSLEGWLGVILGTIVAITAAPGVVVFPVVYWLVQGMFPVKYFVLLAVALACNLIGGTAWLLGTIDE